MLFFLKYHAFACFFVYDFSLYSFFSLLCLQLCLVFPRQDQVLIKLLRNRHPHFPQMFFHRHGCSSPCFWLTLFLVSPSSGSLFHLYIHPRWCRVSEQAELDENTDCTASSMSQLDCLQNYSWVFVVLYSYLNHLTFIRPHQWSLTTVPCGI